MTSHRLSGKITWVFPILALALVIALALTSVGQARADEDPAGCDNNAVGLSIKVFRSDGTTVITGGDTVMDNEDIKYQATLIHQAAVTGCAFEGGDWDIVTPDGVSHDVLPGGGPLPQVGGANGVGPTILSEFVDYQVNHADENVVSEESVIAAESNYGQNAGVNGENGICHESDDDLADCAQAGITTVTTVEHQPTIATQIHDDATDAVITFTEVPPGTLVHDQATVTGIAGVPVTGIVTFLLFDGITCATPNFVSDEEVALVNGVAHPSATVGVPPGGLSYLASYPGDDNYKPVALDQAECEWVDTIITVQLETEIHKAPHDIVAFGSTLPNGTVVHDKVTVSGNAGVPTGTVDIALFDNSTCSGDPKIEYLLIPLVAGMAESADATIGVDTSSSNLSYMASYSGDGVYPAISAGDAIPACEHLVEKSVGGVTEFLAGGSDSSSGSIALLAGGAAAVLAIMAAGGWYTRRRWMGNN